MSADLQLGLLTTEHLGSEIAVTFEMATILGTLTSVQHSTGYSKGFKTMVVIKRDGWSWVKSIDSDSIATITTHTPASEVLAQRNEASE